MSEKLCALRKIGGGTLKETALWTNPNPSSSQGTQTITLNQSYEKFNFVKIRFKTYTSDPVNANTTKSVYMTPTDLYNSNNANQNAIVTLGRRGQNGEAVCKYIYTNGSYNSIYLKAAETNGGIVLDISGVSC